MYKPHQDALSLPLDIDTPTREVRGDRTIPLVSATASRDDQGRVHVSLANIDADHSKKVRITLDDMSVKKVSGTILHSRRLTDLNTFENPDKIKLRPFKDAKYRNGAIEVDMPAHSIVTLEIE